MSCPRLLYALKWAVLNTLFFTAAMVATHTRPTPLFYLYAVAVGAVCGYAMYPNTMRLRRRRNDAREAERNDPS